MPSSSPSHSLQQQQWYEGKVGMTSWLPCNWSIDSNATCKTSCHSCRHSSGRRERAPARGEELRALRVRSPPRDPAFRTRVGAHSRGGRAHLTPATASAPLKPLRQSVGGRRAHARVPLANLRAAVVEASRKSGSPVRSRVAPFCEGREPGRSLFSTRTSKGTASHGWAWALRGREVSPSGQIGGSVEV